MDGMSSLAHGLLEQAVRGDAWLRTTDSALVHPVSALLLAVLVGLLVIAILRAGRRIILAVVAMRLVPGVRTAPRRRRSGPRPRARVAPTGGRGPRAPGARRCRPVELPVAH